MWRTSRQACLLCPWARHLTGRLRLYVADRWWGRAVYPSWWPSLTKDMQTEHELIRVIIILHSDCKFFIGLGFIGLRSRLLPGHFRTLAFLFTRKIIKNFDLWPKAPSRINVVYLLIRKCIFSVSDSSSTHQRTFYCRSTRQK